jgi:Sel1 repeat
VLRVVTFRGQCQNAGRIYQDPQDAAVAGVKVMRIGFGEIHAFTKSMPATLIIRCGQCGHESDIQYRYCAMCGTKLPSQEPRSSLVAMSKKPVRPGIEEQARSVSSEATRQTSEPSLLAPSDDTNARLAYLLEDDSPERHRGRSVAILLMLIGISVAGWHGRQQLRSYVASQFARHPNNLTDQVGSPEAPGSEFGLGMANNAAGTAKPTTAVGDLPVTTAQNPSALRTEPAPVAPPDAQNASLIQSAVTESSALDDGAPASKAASPAAVSDLQAASPAPIATAAPAATASERFGKAAQNDGQEEASPKQEALVSASAARKKSQPEVKQAPRTASDADQLEAQGEKYLYGIGVPTSCSLARRNLEAAAAHGNVTANRVLGRMYATGHCVGRDLPHAYRWFAKALRKDPNNDGLAHDLQVLWTKMSVEERQIAIGR